eukprot:6750373-Pyramimonas_sp.AAC.1
MGSPVWLDVEHVFFVHTDVTDASVLRRDRRPITVIAQLEQSRGRCWHRRGRCPLGSKVACPRADAVRFGQHLLLGIVPG